MKKYLLRHIVLNGAGAVLGVYSSVKKAKIIPMNYRYTLPIFLKKLSGEEIELEGPNKPEDIYHCFYIEEIKINSISQFRCHWCKHYDSGKDICTICNKNVDIFEFYPHCPLKKERK